MKSKTEQTSGPYDHRQVEKTWSRRWLETGVYEPDLSKAKKPFYNLMMFPYPSAEGLHVGNMYAFSGADIFGRYQRMLGNDVFEPIGLDGFGIHSENYAIKIGKHPAEQAKVSEANFYRQLSMIGNGFAWNERLETYDPEYYKWTQWIFVQMFKKGLAYKASSLVNWCPSCKTVLADEQVEDGKCERCKSEVQRKEAKQWFFKITEYADRLLSNIEQLKWPEKIRIAQRQWIGKGKGLSIHFSVEGLDTPITVWTKFWETVFGVTFLVLAPEYELLSKLPIPTSHKKDVDAYVKAALNKTEQQRKIGEGNKTGVFTGVYAINPVNGQKVPVWIADYVLAGVGTGAVMGVPSHDERDFEFAKKYKLGMIQVVSYADVALDKAVKEGKKAAEGEGVLINSGTFDGQDAWGDGKKNMADWMCKQGYAEWKTTYHLRDWLISRQRFWGAPIPMVECEKCGWQAVSEDQLPVELPFIKDYKPTGDGKSPLAKASKDWLFAPCPSCGGQAKRETDVCDTFLDSSWYFLRYPSLGSKTADTKPFDPAITKKWQPVNAYIGGAEHAVLHLLYSRFVTMALKDWGHLDFEEPFPFLFGHGLIIKDGSKMSKSKGNVVNPDEYIEKFGADTLRTYLMFLGPYDQGGDFRDTGIAGMYRWLQKVWRLYTEKGFAKTTSALLAAKVQKTIKKCTRDMADFKFNTSISAMMECTNLWQEQEQEMAKEDALSLLKLLAPFAPYMTEELYQKYFAAQHAEYRSLHKEQWPTYNEKLTLEDQIEIAIQVNGKFKGTSAVSRDQAMDKKHLEKVALEYPRVAELVGKGNPKTIIVIPGKVVNIVL
jgi:leucyl-tRNA synthetase